MTNPEPGITGAVIGGVSLALIVEPLNDIMVELGVRPKLSSAVTRLLMIVLTILPAVWARARTVTTTSYSKATALAQALPMSADANELNQALADSSLPPVDLNEVPVPPMPPDLPRTILGPR